MAIQETDLRKRQTSKELRKQIRKDFRRKESGKVNRSQWENVGGMEIPKAYHTMGLVWIDQYGQQWLPKQTANELRAQKYGDEPGDNSFDASSSLNDTSNVRVVETRNVTEGRDMRYALANAGSDSSVFGNSAEVRENLGDNSDEPMFIFVSGRPMQVDDVLDDPSKTFAAINSATWRKQERLVQKGFSTEFIDRAMAASNQVTSQNVFIIQAAADGRLEKNLRRFVGGKPLSGDDIATASARLVEQARLSLSSYLGSELRCDPPEDMQPTSTPIEVFNGGQLKAREVSA